jgi:hypothetical protein
MITQELKPPQPSDEQTLEQWFGDEMEMERWLRALAIDPTDKAEAETAGPTVKPPTKKEQIIALYQSGLTDIAEIVYEVSARPSYVAQVLQSAGLLTGYYDLYTPTASDQNFYSRFFRNVLAFKTVEAARASVKRLDRLYNYFERIGDRAGQHHAMALALTGKNRARWSGKHEAARVFSDWLAAH